MTPRPLDAGAFAERLYARLAPYAATDAAEDWALLVYLGAMGQMFQDVDTYASDGPNGEIGWSMLVDLNRAPLVGLPWLGQFVGAQVDTSLSDADQRQQIRDVNSWKRGSVPAMKAAPLPWLTGAKTVVFRERDPAACVAQPAYGLSVTTYTSETSDATAVLNAILSVKPAGIILNYRVLDGQDYESLYLNYATYQDVYNHYPDYAGVMNDEPPV